MIYGKPLPITEDAALYVQPGDRRFYHLSKGCRCFRRGEADALREINKAQADERQLQPCFFCGYSPNILTRRERVLEIATLPFELIHLPAGVLAITALSIGFVVALNLYHSRGLPLWACIITGAGIAVLGVFLDSRFGWWVD